MSTRVWHHLQALSTRLPLSSRKVTGIAAKLGARITDSDIRVLVPIDLVQAVDERVSCDSIATLPTPNESLTSDAGLRS